jgi:hypothetical protein
MSFNYSGLLEPQIPHAARLFQSINENNYALDLSETGTGKTYVACALARAIRQPLFVICPKTIINQWEKTLILFDIKATGIINYERLSRGVSRWMRWKKQRDLMQPDNLRAKREMPVFTFPPDSLIIVDEGHRCKGQDTSNAWMLIALKLQGYKILLASATAASSPVDMKALGYVCGLHKLYDFNQFCQDYSAEYLPGYDVMTWNRDNAEAEQSMLHLNRYLFDVQKCASRLIKKDFGNLFPESQIIAQAYDLGVNSPVIQSVYEEMERELAKLERHTQFYSRHVFATLVAARRKAELCKVPVFVEMIEDLYDEGKSVVLFTNFEDTAASVFERLSVNLKQLVGFITGDKAKQRQADITAFNCDQKRIMIANIAAGGCGVDLHDLHGNFPRASIVSPTWSAFNMRQSLGRVWRQGGLTKSYQRIVYASGCIEEQICQRVQFRLKCVDVLNGGEIALNDSDLIEHTNFS